MDNALKFLIRLQADGGNVLSVARQTTQQLDAIQRKAQGVGSKLREAFSFSSFKSSLMSIPGMQFLMNPYTLISAGVGAVVKLGAEAEQTSVAFTTLVGSESKAADMLGKITDFANTSPFDKMGLVQNAQQMLSFGVSTDKVLPLLKQLGDISGGNKEKLSSLSLVMGQVSSTGYLMGQDLMQFINAGFNPILELSKMTGISVDKLKDKMSRGEITIRNVEQAIAHATDAGGQFNGMMEAQSQTVAGKFSTAIDNVQNRMIGLSQGINSSLGEVLDFVNNSVIPTLFDGIQTVFNALSVGIGFIMKYKTAFMILGGVIAAVWAVSKAYTMALVIYQGVMTAITIATNIWTAAQWLLNIAMNANPIDLVILSIGALITIVAVCWEKFAGFRALIMTCWDAIKGFGTIIKDYVINRFKELLTAAGKIGEALSKLFSGDFSGAGKSALQAVRAISGVDSASKAFNSGKELLGNTGANFQKHLKQERAKDAASEQSNKKNAITAPTLKGSAGGGGTAEEVVFGAGKGDKTKKSKKGKGGSRKASEEAAIGGRRNTSITMNITKFFDTIHVHMTDKADTAELERIVVQTMNRALAIATSTDR